MTWNYGRSFVVGALALAAVAAPASANDLLFVATGEFNHAAQVNHALESRNRVAYQQRILLPMAAQEGRGRHAAEERDSHDEDSIVVGELRWSHRPSYF